MLISRKLVGRTIRHVRVRRVVKGTAERPRLAVFRSLNHIYAHLVDDLTGRTILTVSSLDKEVVPKGAPGKGKIDAGKLVGKKIASLAKEKGIDRVCFDRGGYLYHGRVKAVADGAREGGLSF